MSFADEYQRHQQETQQGGDFYKFKKGDNKFRILTEPVKKVSRWGHGICYPGAVYCDPKALEEEYKKKMAEYAIEVDEAKKAGLPKPKEPTRPRVSAKWSVWAIDRATGNNVILEMPDQIAEKLINFMTSDEYRFEIFPMPYDVNITADGKVGTKDVKYDMLPARANTPVTEEELDKLATLTPIADIIARMQAKKKREDGVAAGEAADPAAAAADEGIQYPDEDINPADIPF